MLRCLQHEVSVVPDGDNGQKTGDGAGSGRSRRLTNRVFSIYLYSLLAYAVIAIIIQFLVLPSIEERFTSQIFDLHRSGLEGGIPQPVEFESELVQHSDENPRTMLLIGGKLLALLRERPKQDVHELARQVRGEVLHV